MRIAASVAMALAIAALPVAAQAKSPAAPGTGSQGASATSGNQQAPVNEADLLIPENGKGAPAAVGAAQGQPGQAGAAAAAPVSTSGVSTWDFVRMIIILAAVIGAIYLIFWLLRRGAGKRITENNLIKVLGSRSLAGSRSLHLVEVGTSVYLVGASDGGVELIAEITDKESLDSVRLKAAEEGPTGKRSFQQILSEIFRPARQGVSLGEGLGFLRGQRDKLRKL